MMAATMTAELASSFARLALAHVRREFPNKPEHVLNGLDDVRAPSALHPVFYGSFDWHSCVHGYWLLATVLRTYPDIGEAGAIRSVLEEQFTADKIAGEVSYLGQPLRAGFERPYGWAWLLMLAAELTRHHTEESQRWSAALKPLAVLFVSRFTSFLPKATYPTRVGTHFNSAFALALALEYAEVMRDKRFGRLLRGRAVSWYSGDVDCQAWEPSGDDFLSSALIEAECMRRSLDPPAFEVWVSKFLPRIDAREPATLFEPARVSDRTDGKIAHLDGLNLSRAWCWRSLANTWSGVDSRRTIALEAFSLHVDASLSHVSGDYAGEHWLATFALLALQS